MLDKQTAQALMLGIVTMQLTKGVDWTVERNIKITIGVFYVALMACMGSFFYVRYEIKKKSDTREVRIMGDGYEERMSVQSYDTKHVKGQMKMVRWTVEPMKVLRTDKTKVEWSVKVLTWVDFFCILRALIHFSF